MAYSILAFNREFLGKLRDDIDVPFLLAADYSAALADKPASANNAILAYVPPKRPQDYEAYVNNPQKSKKVALIEHREKVVATASIRQGFPWFYSIIDEEFKFGRKSFPYSSLPFIVATNGDEFPERYFLTFSADEISGSDKADEAAVTAAMTRIVQSACEPHLLGTCTSSPPTRAISSSAKGPLTRLG